MQIPILVPASNSDIFSACGKKMSLLSKLINGISNYSCYDDTVITPVSTLNPTKLGPAGLVKESANVLGDLFEGRRSQTRPSSNPPPSRDWKSRRPLSTRESAERHELSDAAALRSARIELAF